MAELRRLESGISPTWQSTVRGILGTPKGYDASGAAIIGEGPPGMRVPTDSNNPNALAAREKAARIEAIKRDKRV